MASSLSECLKSVTAQTLKDIEIICIDNGSSGTSRSANRWRLKSYAQKDARIAIIERANASWGALKNEALHLAKGEYVAFLDTDGYYPADDVLEALYNAAKENGVPIAGGELGECRKSDERESELEQMSFAYIFGGSGITSYKDYQFDKGYQRFIFDRGFLIKNEIVFPDYRHYEAQIFFVNAMLKAEKFYAISKPVYAREKDYRKTSEVEVLDNRQIIDALQGIEKNLQLSKRLKFAKLHYITALRIEMPIYMNVIKSLKRLSPGIIAQLIKIWLSSDAKLLKKFNPNYKIKIHPLKFWSLMASKVKANSFRGLKERIKVLEQNEKNYQQTENLYLDFFKFCFSHNVQENTILLIEPNNCHGVVIPSYVKYILDLGYNVDLIMRPEVAELEPMCRFKFSKAVNINVLSYKFIDAFLWNKDKINKYQAIFFTSHVMYASISSITTPAVFDHFPQVTSYKDKIFIVEHHLDMADQELLKADRVVTLADFYDKNKIAVNPHFFGDIKITSKNNSKTVFITTGAIIPERRNYHLLVKAVEELDSQGIKDFSIIIIGYGDLTGLSPEIKKYFDIRGHVPFEQLFQALEEADFFLPLLDPENPEHDRYITTGTSGNFLLIYGFCKPCLIHDKFTAKYGFNNGNALVYTANNELAAYMKKAIEMNLDEYKSLQNKLGELSSDIEEKSRQVMRRIIGHAKV
ncbi:MAG: glycosyltransferase [Spirochaetes bacterium]|nr:glycosyltransferase [Spirochaetota bacterium]